MRNCNNLLSISLGAAVVLHQTGAFVLPQRTTLTHGSHSTKSLRPNTKFYNSGTDDDSSSDSIPSDTDSDPQPPAVESNDDISS